MDPSHVRIAAELLCRTAAPALVREVAGVLAREDIPVMPLKGTLLQQLVYRSGAFRAVSDVDILVPPSRFRDARRLLRKAGFTGERQEPGGWEVALRRPRGLLEIDLHQRLSSTVRSGLRPEDLFRRAHLDTALFGVAVMVPDASDLYAHLLLHFTLSWLSVGRLHHPQDFESVPMVLGLAPNEIAHHLASVGLRRHAILTLPLISETDGSFTRRLMAVLRPTAGEKLLAEATRAVCARRRPGSWWPRTAGLLLAPSLTEACRDAVVKRISTGL